MNSTGMGWGSRGAAHWLTTKFLAFALALCLSVAPLCARGAQASEGTSNPKYAAIVVEADTGRVLYSSRADSERYPASLTKMMTLYMLFKAMDEGKVKLTDKFTVSTRATQQAPSKLGLGVGAKISVEDAIESLVIQSANDIAVVVAEALGGTEARFAKMMTDQARAIGMNRTSYKNASGLPNPGQITTARDLYVLADRLMTDYPQYYHYFGERTFTYGARTFKNHNHLVGKVDGVDGIKTGYTRASGFNLVTSTSRDGHRIIAVVLGGRSVKSRDDHMKSLIGTHFAKLKKDYSNAVAGFSPAPRFKPDGSAGLAFAPIPRPKPSQDGSVDLAAALPDPAAAPSVPDPQIASLEGTVVAPAAFANGYDAATPADGSLVVSTPRPSPLREAEGEAQGDISEPDMQDSQGVPANWGIQIGAYVSQDTATSRLQAARQALPEVLASMNQLIVRVDVDGTTFYRARFGPFTKSQADSTCAALAPQGFRCFAVAQEDGTEFRTAGSPGAAPTP